MVINVSKKFANKLVSSIFEEIHKDNWFTTTYKYCIDSKYRKYVRLDRFLKEQIDNPSTELLKIAEQFIGIESDRAIIEILKYVHNNIKYKRDIDNYGKDEYWATSLETFNKKFGDCDDINGMIYVIARLSGIPSYLLYCAIGDVKSGGHFWTMYLSTTTDKLYTIDGTYYYSNDWIEYRTTFKFSEDRYKSIWYLFNSEGIWKYK